MVFRLTSSWSAEVKALGNWSILGKVSYARSRTEYALFMLPGVGIIMHEQIVEISDLSKMYQKISINLWNVFNTSSTSFITSVVTLVGNVTEVVAREACSMSLETAVHHCWWRAEETGNRSFEQTMLLARISLLPRSLPRPVGRCIWAPEWSLCETYYGMLYVHHAGFTWMLLLHLNLRVLWHMFRLPKSIYLSRFVYCQAPNIDL